MLMLAKAGTMLGRSGGGAGAGTNDFYAAITGNGLSTNLKCCLDFGNASCYGGSGQTITELSGNHGSDFWLGDSVSATTNDPTFHGSAGSLSSAEYFSTDGGDLIQEKTRNTYMDAFHKDNATLTLAMVWFQPTSFAHMAANGNRGSDPEPSFDFLGVTASGLFLDVYDASGGTVFFKSKSGLTANAWHFGLVSFDEAAGNVIMRINGSSTLSTGQSYTSPAAGNGTKKFSLLDSYDGSDPSDTGTRIAAFAAWSRALNDTEGATLYNAIKGRWGI